jgi:hypothetical protein
MCVKLTRAPSGVLCNWDCSKSPRHPRDSSRQLIAKSNACKKAKKLSTAVKSPTGKGREKLEPTTCRQFGVTTNDIQLRRAPLYLVVQLEQASYLPSHPCGWPGALQHEGGWVQNIGLYYLTVARAASLARPVSYERASRSPSFSISSSSFSAFGIRDSPGLGVHGWLGSPMSNCN